MDCVEVKIFIKQEFCRILANCINNTSLLRMECDIYETDVQKYAII